MIYNSPYKYWPAENGQALEASSLKIYTVLPGRGWWRSLWRPLLDSWNRENWSWKIKWKRNSRTFWLRSQSKLIFIHIFFFDQSYFELVAWGPSRACVQVGLALYHEINVNTWDFGWMSISSRTRHNWSCFYSLLRNSFFFFIKEIF